MKIFARINFKTAIGMVLLLGLTSCVRTFVVSPAGHLNDKITFSFHKVSLENVVEKKPSAFNILLFVVQQQNDALQWTTVWEIAGEDSLDSIIYGANYDGLSEVTPAEPLAKNGRYRVFADESTWPNPVGHAGSGFFISEDGTVVPTNLEF